MAEQSIARGSAESSASGKRRVGSLIGGSIAAALAVVLVTAGTWALWVDRVDRHGGFVAIGTTDLNTGTYAIQAPLTGDGPSWLYGSTVFGTGRVHATSRSAHPMFIGIARTRDVARYLDGTGYGTIQHLATNEITTHEGGAPAVPPARLPIWAASAQGTGQQTLLWKPRSGDWSIVMMNTDASPGVALHGDLAAKVPLLPWVAAGWLLIGAVFAALGGWLLVCGLRVRRASVPAPTERSQPASTNAPVAAHS